MLRWLLRNLLLFAGGLNFNEKNPCFSTDGKMAPLGGAVTLPLVNWGKTQQRLYGFFSERIIRQVMNDGEELTYDEAESRKVYTELFRKGTR